MNINQMKESKYLKKEDVLNKPMLVTITGCEQFNVGREDKPDMKWGLTFAECSKPLILNTTKITALASIIGSEETDDWVGEKIVLFHDPTILYKGKKTGGIGVRAPRAPAGVAAAPARTSTAPARPAAPAPTAPSEPNVLLEDGVDPGTEEDDVPF